jgi:histidinol-phosphate aminotransferase
VGARAAGRELEDLAGRDVAEELNRRQHPAPLSTLSVALAVAGLEDPPDTRPVVEERERLAGELRRIGLDPWPSAANFLYVPFDGAEDVGERLLKQGLPVRRLAGAIRITVRDQPDDDRLVAAIRSAWER